MIWYLVIAAIFATVGIIAAKKDTHFPHQVALAGMIACLILTVVNSGYTNYTPRGFTEQSVLVAEENGVVKVTDDVYYQDANGDYYAKQDLDKTKQLLVPFYRPEFEKVDPPVLENGNFVAIN